MKVTQITSAVLAMHAHASQAKGSTPRMAIHMDNGPAWLAVDHCATDLGWVIVPVPHFFSVKQINHLIEQAELDCVICAANALPLWQNQGFVTSDVEGGLFFLTRSIESSQALPTGTHKITFTSGTTSEPKGVCLSREHLSEVGRSLAAATAHLNITKHISLLPYSVLLENMAATYANAFAQTDVLALPLSSVGMTGSGQLDVTVMLKAITDHQADSMIMMPQMLKQLVNHLLEQPQDLSFIKFIAVGGAVCSAALLNQAQQLGLPVYQGYGISECGSVISLNNTADAVGSVGRPLQHCQVSLAGDGEITVKGPQFLGYLAQNNDIQAAVDSEQSEFETGDIGHFDDQGRLYITGRKKNLIINSFGRNILPDWIEGELLAIPAVLQAAVCGEAQPFLSALCVTTLSQTQLEAEVSKLNQTLPDYAQLKSVHKVDAFTPANNQLTASGKLKHPQIFKTHQKLLENIYANRIETATHTV